jgi:hypothetical protein
MRRFSLLILSLLLPAISQAATVALSPLQDGSLFEDTNGTLAGGAASLMYVGRVGSNDATPLRRGMVQFDLSSIPAGSVITGVTLQMNVSQVRSSTASVIGLHSITASWNEGTATTSGGAGGPRSGTDATWTHRNGTLDWAAAGGDFLGLTSASQSITAVGVYSWTSSGLIADVQGWVDAPGGNNGWLLQGDETTPQSVKVLATKEAASGRPSLSVTYVSVPEPSTAGMLSLGIMLFSRRKRLNS